MAAHQATTQLASGAHVRPALSADADALDSLLLYLDEVHSTARPDMFRVPVDSPRGPTFLAEILADPEQAIFIAAVDGEVVGFVHTGLRDAAEHPTNVQRRFAMIDTVAVLPGWQGQGVGRALVETAIAWAEARGVLDQQIIVHAFNEPARKLYESLGFTPSFTALRRIPS